MNKENIYLSELFYKHHSFLAKVINNRFVEDLKTEIVITGEPGTGKSFLAYKTAYEYYKNILNKENYKELLYKSIIIPAPLELLEDKEELEFFRIQINEALKNDEVNLIIFDEAIDIFGAKDFMNKEQIKMVKILRKARKYKKSFIFCIPNINELTKDVRTRSLNCWTHLIYKRNKKFSCGAFFVKMGLEMNINNIIYNLNNKRYGFRVKEYMGLVYFSYNEVLYNTYKAILNKKRKEILELLNKNYVDEGLLKKKHMKTVLLLLKDYNKRYIKKEDLKALLMKKLKKSTALDYIKYLENYKIITKWKNGYRINNKQLDELILNLMR